MIQEVLKDEFIFALQVEESNSLQYHSIPHWYIYSITPAAKAQGSLWKRGQGYCKSQRNRLLSVSLRLLEMLDVTPIKSQQHDRLNMKWARTSTIDMLKLTGEAQEASALKEYRQLKKADCEKIFSSEELTKQLPHIQWSSPKTCIQVTFYRLRRV